MPKVGVGKTRNETKPETKQEATPSKLCHHNPNTYMRSAAKACVTQTVHYISIPYLCVCPDP